MPNQIVVEVPQNLQSSNIKEALAAVLYHNGTLTEKEARLMIGKSRREFEEEVIPKFGLSMIGGTPGDVNLEREACFQS